MARTGKQEDHCARCNSENLTYDSKGLGSDGKVYFPYECEDCGHKGREVFVPEYSHSD